MVDSEQLEAAAPRTVAEIDWERWTPDDRATLLFVREGDRLLLIRKKRGLGAGKINAPGGRIEPGETAADGAVREVVEELLVTPGPPRWCGEHYFQFVDGYTLHVHVFASDSYEGVPTETDEAIPLWAHVSELPYDEMWEDDRLWLPMMLAGKLFSGRYVFDDDAMLDHVLTEVSASPLPA